MMKRYQVLASICLVVIATLMSFQPALKNDFVNWDDDLYLRDNPLVQDLSGGTIKRIFSSFCVSNYHPLTIFSYAVEHRFFKFDPRAYHLTNLILHLLNCIFVFWLIFLISQSLSIALLTSLLFGVHPLHVESVAWVSERKDVLYAFFYLSALIAYAYYVRSVHKAKYYVLSLALFIFSLLSKSAAITLTPIIFLVDYISNRKYDKRVLTDKIPFLILSLVFGIIALYSQSGAIRSEIALDLFSKVRVAGYSIFFYIGKLFFPLKLSCIYPYPRISHDFVPAVYSLSLIGVIGSLIVVCYSLRYTKKIFFGVLFFIFSIFLNLQFVPLGAIITADRYTYIPSIGIFFIIALVFSWALRHGAHNSLLKACLIGTVILTLISFVRLTRDRCEVWESGFVLWNDAIDKYGSEYIPGAYFNRGMIYLEYSENQLSFSDLRTALELYRGRLGLKHDNEADYQKILGSKSDYAALFNYLGIKFSEIRAIDQAIILFKGVILKNPSDAQAHFNLCVTYANLGRYKDAIVQGEQAVKINPSLSKGYYVLAVAYYSDKQYESAQVNLEKSGSLGFQVSPEFKKELEVKGVKR